MLLPYSERLSLSLHFNGHFPGEPGLAGVYWSKGWWRWWWQLDYWSYKSCKAPAKSSPPTNQHPVFFTGWMPFLSPNQKCQSMEGKNITFHGLAYPELTWEVFQLCLWPLIAPGYLGGGLACLSSALWYQYSERLKACNLPTLHFRCIRGDMIEMYKILTGKYDVASVPTLVQACTYVTRDFRNLFQIWCTKVLFY